MNVNQNLLALMVALVAGSALGAGTTAGTVISNQASATFTDPATNAPVTAPVVSNTVTTTVLPIPALDIIYKGPAGTTSDNAGVTTPTTNNDGTSAGNANTNFKKSGVLPGSNVDTSYMVLNNGNVDNYVVTLNNTPLNNPGGVVVQYFLAGDTAFATPITTVTVPASGQVDIVQRIKIPAAAAVGTVISVSPYGTAAAGTSSGNAYPAVDETNNVNVPATPAANKDLEFTDAIIFSPTVTAAPTPPVDPANPVVPSTPGTNIVTPPIANAANPLNPVSPPGTPGDPSDPVKPGYADPLNPGTAAIPGTPIVVSGNSQIAYPPADANSAPDVVTFKNVVSTPVVAGTPADTVSLFPTDSGGNPIGTNNGDGSFLLPTGQTVRFLKPDGTPLPTAVNPADGKTYPVVGTPAGGGTTPYLTQVVYPDSNPNNNTTTVDNTVPIVVTVGADSGNDADIKANGTTTDTIFPAAAQFGDVAAGGLPDRSLVGQGNAAQVVVPGTPAASGAPAPGTATDSTAVFPMTIQNYGQYGDTYTLSGTVPVKLSDGTTVNVPVRYTNNVGTSLPSGAAPNTFILPLVGPGTNSVAFFAVIDLPATAAATNGVPLIVTQTAVGNFSTVVLTDVNDQITIGVIGGAVPTKTVFPLTSAKPGDDLTYTITAKNAYNTPVKNYVLKEADGAVTNVFANSVFKSVNVAVSGATGTVLYRFNGGAWQTSSVPTIALNTVTSVEVGFDTAAPNTAIDSADTLPVGAQLVETLVVTVK